MTLLKRVEAGIKSTWQHQAQTWVCPLVLSDLAKTTRSGSWPNILSPAKPPTASRLMWRCQPGKVDVGTGSAGSLAKPQNSTTMSRLEHRGGGTGAACNFSLHRFAAARVVGVGTCHHLCKLLCRMWDVGWVRASPQREILNLKPAWRGAVRVEGSNSGRGGCRRCCCSATSLT